MEENNFKPANEVSTLSEKIETTLMPEKFETSESIVDLTSISENDNIIKGKCVLFFTSIFSVFYQRHLSAQVLS